MNEVGTLSQLFRYLFVCISYFPYSFDICDHWVALHPLYSMTKFVNIYKVLA